MNATACPITSPAPASSLLPYMLPTARESFTIKHPTRLASLPAAPRLGHTEEMVLVTPEMAANWLTHLYDRQRKVNWSWVDQLARTITEDRWQVTPDPVIFDTDHKLRNAMHRCEAIVKAGKAVWMKVITGASDALFRVLDTGRTRSAYDLSTILGYDFTPDQIALADAMIEGISKNRQSRRTLSKVAKLEFAETHRAAIEFATASFGNHAKGLCTKTVKAPVARAWYTQDRARLAEFGKVLLTNEATDAKEDSGATRLNNWILRTLATGGRLDQSQVYRKTSRALQAFLAREAVTALREVREELFLLPGEEKTELAKC